MLRDSIRSEIDKRLGPSAKITFEPEDGGGAAAGEAGGGGVEGAEGGAGEKGKKRGRDEGE